MEHRASVPFNTNSSLPMLLLCPMKSSLLFSTPAAWTAFSCSLAVQLSSFSVSDCTFGHSQDIMETPDDKNLKLIVEGLSRKPHPSHPYRRTDFTLVEKNLSLVFRESCLKSHSGYKSLNAYLALLISTLIALSALLSVLVTLPR